MFRGKVLLLVILYFHLAVLTGRPAFPVPRLQFSLWAISAVTKYKTVGGVFEKWRYTQANRELYYESVKLKQLKPEVLSKSFHLL